MLDFSNAMAALNCTALGARGGIKSQADAELLMKTGARYVNKAYRVTACTPDQLIGDGVDWIVFVPPIIRSPDHRISYGGLNDG